MSYQALRRDTHVARKKHRCIWCGEEIGKGDKYLDAAGTMDGNFEHSKWHPECDKFALDNCGPGSFEFAPHENERPSGEPNANP